MRENDKMVALIHVLMAVAGAMARMLNKGDKPLQIGRVLGELFVAGFMGLIFYWITRETDIKPGWAFAAAGIAGWVGPTVLDWLATIVEKKTGTKLTPDKKEGPKE
ncbi:hypothetical protein AGMMS49992_16770 [Clostridia bacterium]|nr:hypothetical protein AGMMS49992_16770 [Clostridia bacterium]